MALHFVLHICIKNKTISYLIVKNAKMYFFLLLFIKMKIRNLFSSVSIFYDRYGASNIFIQSNNNFPKQTNFKIAYACIVLRVSATLHKSPI